MKLSASTLRIIYPRLKSVNPDLVFTDDGSVEYKEFMKQFKLYQLSERIVTNYYSMVIIKDGINKFANENFWKEISQCS